MGASAPPHFPLSLSAKAGDPVRRGFSIYHSRLWYTGSPACCLARRHGCHLFGHITDRLAIGQVDQCDLPAGKEDTVVAVAIERSDSETLADKGLRNSPE